MKYMDSVPDSAACNEAVKLTVKRGFGGLKGFVNGVMRTIARNMDQICYPDAEKEPVQYLSVKYSVPEWLVQRFTEQYGAEACERSLAAYLMPHPTSVQVDTDRSSVEAIIASLEQQGITVKRNEQVERALFLSGYEALDEIEEFENGLLYVQDTASMLAVELAAPKQGDHVIDVCAAPGGKATELGSRIGEGGMLLANDISNSRAKALLRNLEIQGVGRLLVTSEDPEKLVTLYPAFFDKILLDAPCSGEGMFRKESSMLRYYSENGPEHYVPIQKKLIEQAYQMLAEGGELLYSTCTFSVKENEEVIAGLLDAHPDMEVQEITPGYEGFAPGVSVNGRDLSRCVHIFPQRMEGEGHFVALLKKQGESRKRQPSRLLETTKKLPKEAEEFLAGVRMDWKNGSFALVKDQLYFLPEGVCAAKGLRYLRTGLSLGTVKKNRFEPSQALAAYLKKEEYVSCLTIPKGDDRVMRYLKGETLSFSEEECQGKKGWVLVCLDDFPLGWGKINNGTLKNKYYAGWRMV